MKTMILATAAVLALGVGSAFAGDGDGPAANTTFTELPGVIAQAQVGQAPTAYARNQATGKPTAAFVTTSRSSGTWLFAPNPNQGGNS
jgi:hypothetical protein